MPAQELKQATIETTRLAIPALELAQAIPETERLALPALELEQFDTPLKPSNK